MIKEEVTYREVEVTYNTEYHKAQSEIFLDPARYKVVAKGRRFGFTRGLAKYCIKRMLEVAGQDNGILILWVDTIYSNIERYFDRYFKPELSDFKRNTWKYNRNKSEFTFFNSSLDFRSSDKPENIEGFGYHLVVVNEAGIVLRKRNLWNESILPMTLDYLADVIIGGTPKGKKLKTNEKHLFYELYERGKDKQQSKYKSFNFSSYDNDLLDADDIEELEKEIPAHLRDQEIGGKFIDIVSSGIIQREWFNYYEQHELASKVRFRKIQVWDTAFKKMQENDFNVCETWIEMKDGYYLIDVFRERMEFPELKKKAVELYQREKPDQVWIEDKASGISLIQELKRDTRIPIIEIKVNQDKIENVNACAPVIEAGRVYLPFSAPWLETFIDEAVEFPNSEFDDQVDIMSKYINKVKRSLGSETIKIKLGGKIKHKKYKGYRR